MKITLDVSNERGSWPLNDDDWLAIEAAGWNVCWARDDARLLPHQKRGGRYMGQLARSASKHYPASIPKSVSLGFARQELGDIINWDKERCDLMADESDLDIQITNDFDVIVDGLIVKSCATEDEATMFAEGYKTALGV